MFSGSGCRTTRSAAARQPKTAANRRPGTRTRRTAAPPAFSRPGRGRHPYPSVVAVRRVGTVDEGSRGELGVLDIRIPRPAPGLLFFQAEHRVVHTARPLVAYRAGRAPATG